MTDKQKPANALPFEDLTDKERAFAYHYNELGERHGNITKAAKLAGYQAKYAYQTGRRALRKVRVIEYIQMLRDRLALISSIDREYVLHELALNLQAAKTAGDHGAVNASVRLLGTELGMFIERKELRDTRAAAPPIERMPMADYMKAVKEHGMGQDQGDPSGIPDQAKVPKVVSIKRVR